MSRSLIAALVLCVSFTAIAQQSNDGGAYGSSTGPDSARFGALVGAMTGYRPSFAAPSQVSSAWGSAPLQSCAGVDFDTYVNTVKPQEVLNHLQITYQSGPQAGVANYILTLNTSNPTLPATLDMVDRMFTARYQGFAQMCQAQETTRASSDPYIRRMAEATDQCFAARIAKGSSPGEALRECKNGSVIANETIPGKYDLKAFLSNYTNVKVTGDVEYFLPLLADEKYAVGGIQARAPERSLTQTKGFIEDHARNAINKLLDGAKPNDIPACKGENYSRPPSGPDAACIPDAASALVRGKAFAAARQLSAAEQDMYASALSEQIAAVSVQSALIALRQALANMAPSAGSSVPAGEVIVRRARVLVELNRLESDAQQLAKIADQRAQIARTQLLAMQRAGDQMASRREAADLAVPVPKESPISGFRSFFGM